eukprot:Sspe_Gene.102843::Locus_78676_Transcript_1_3_Confidence_0.400_Length_685::g.102843::m.102843
MWRAQLKWRVRSGSVPDVAAVGSAPLWTEKTSPEPPPFRRPRLPPFWQLPSFCETERRWKDLSGPTLSDVLKRHTHSEHSKGSGTNAVNTTDEGSEAVTPAIRDGDKGTEQLVPFAGTLMTTDTFRENFDFETFIISKAPGERYFSTNPPWIAQYVVAKFRALLIKLRDEDICIEYSLREKARRTPKRRVAIEAMPAETRKQRSVSSYQYDDEKTPAL